jgi:hypothetical protein
VAFFFHGLQIIQHDIQVIAFLLQFSAFFLDADNELFELLAVAPLRAVHFYQICGFFKTQTEALSTQDQPQPGTIGRVVNSPAAIPFWAQVALFLVEADGPEYR